MSKRKLWVHHFDIPLTYQKTEALQYYLHQLRLAEHIPDTLLLLEHVPTISMGKRGSASDILIPHSALIKKGYTIATSDRGGQVTYHGPGQLIGYCIFKLYHAQRRLRDFIAHIEQVIISSLAYFGIEGYAHDTHRGVWVKDKKIASVGIAITKGVTRHGFAINIVNDLSAFRDIVPCGIVDVHMTRVIDHITTRTPQQADKHLDSIVQKNKQQAYTQNHTQNDTHLSDLGVHPVLTFAKICARNMASILDYYIEYPTNFPKPEWWNR